MDTGQLMSLRPDEPTTANPVVAAEGSFEEGGAHLPGPLVGSSARKIGRILVDAGRLTHEGLAQILAEQSVSRLHFGEIGIRLGFFQKEDVEFALAKQFGFAILPRGGASVSPEVHTAFTGTGEVVEQTRALRTQLNLRWQESEALRRTLTITSAERGAGRSFIAANLAVAFSQLRSGGRTLLIDAHFARPRQHELFGLDNRVGLSTVLAGLTGRESLHSVPGLSGLLIMPAGPQPPNCEDLLARSTLSRLLTYLTSHFGTILIDSPPWEEGEAAKSLAAAAGAALMVVRSGHTLAGRGAHIAHEMRDRQTTLLGVVLNEVTRPSNP